MGTSPTNLPVSNHIDTPIELTAPANTFETAFAGSSAVVSFGSDRLGLEDNFTYPMRVPKSRAAAALLNRLLDDTLVV